jgi:NAD(P)-dependent dehydrogenase (short-subunit alcohol dehydrogenase family)
MKHVLITGTSRGIGRALVEQFLAAGDRVWAVSRQAPATFDNPERLEWLQMDPLAAAFEEKLKLEAPRFDIVVHNAGTLISKPFAEMKLGDLEEMYAVNVFLPYQLTQRLLPYLNKGAHSIYISSVGGINGTQKFPGLSGYSSSKAALACLAECLQAEFQETSWSFNSLALGAAQTEMLNQAFPGYKAPLSASEMAGFIFRFARNEGGVVKGKSLLVSSSNP